MPKILITNKYDKSVWEILRTIQPDEIETFVLDEVTKKDLINKIHDADYLLVSGRIEIDKEVIDHAKQIKMIQRTGVGLDQIDLEYLETKNIPLYVNHGINSVSVAEHTILLMLATLKNLVNNHTALIQGEWGKQKAGLKTYELFGKTVGLIGIGNIGFRVAQILTSFGAKIIYYDINRLSKETEEDNHFEYRSFENLIAEADIISLHCNLSEKTRNLLSFNEFDKMKSNAIVINTARGALIDEEALIDALAQNKILATGLDVFTNEPLSENHPLKQMKNVVLTSHIGGITSESFIRMYQEAFNNIRQFHEGNLKEIEANLFKRIG